MRHSIFPALAATEAELLQEIYSRTARRKVIEVIKATTEGLDYTWTQREGTSEIIARWMNLNQAQAAKTTTLGGMPFRGPAFPPTSRQSLTSPCWEPRRD
jgi:hypothetical protein